MSTEQKRAEESTTISSSPVSVRLSAADIPGAYLNVNPAYKRGGARPKTW